MCCFGLFARVSDGSRAALSSSRPSSSRGGAASRFAWSAMLLRSTADSFSPWLLHHRPGEPFTRLPDSPQLGIAQPWTVPTGAFAYGVAAASNALFAAATLTPSAFAATTRSPSPLPSRSKQSRPRTTNSNSRPRSSASLFFGRALLSSSRPFCPGAQARADRDAAVPGPLFLPARRPGARPARSADEEKLPADKNDQ